MPSPSYVWWSCRYSHEFAVEFGSTLCRWTSFLWFEEQLVLQSRVRINAGLTLLALGVYTQLALVLKKKQFEPFAIVDVFWD